MAGIGVLAGL